MSSHTCFNCEQEFEDHETELNELNQEVCPFCESESFIDSGEFRELGEAVKDYRPQRKFFEKYWAGYWTKSSMPGMDAAMKEIAKAAWDVFRISPGWYWSQTIFFAAIAIALFCLKPKNEIA